MKSILNKFTRGVLPMLMAVVLSSIMMLSCDKNEMEVENNFPFEVKVMPVPKEIANGKTTEIRLAIQPSGNYTGAQYFIRYFQFDGQGTLSYYDEPPYLPNDLYQLKANQFRLYYTSQSTVSQFFDVWISDNFGNEQKLSFEFNSSN